MYCAFFGFREKPFNITPDPAFIYFSKIHQEAFAHLLYGIDNHVGFMEITGEVGTGKTTVLRTLLNQLDARNYRTALIFNPCLSSAGLMRSINREYGIPYNDLNDDELLHVLNQFLLRQNAEGNTVALVIDEAQNLKRDVLEQIRLISNLETERDKLIQIVLAGQPELEKLLAQPELRQLNQRIAVRYRLRRMDFQDTRDYISHRLAVAGRRDAVTFTPGALRRIYRFSRGVPRLVNIVSDRSLLVGYTRGERRISSRMAGTAVSDVRITEKKRPLRLRPYTAGIVLLAGIVVFAVLGVSHTFIRETPPARSVGDSRGAERSVDENSRDFPHTLRGVMGRMSEAESAVHAFNALAGPWKAEPFSVSSVSRDVKLESLASARSMQIAGFRGNLGGLLRMKLPAIVELTLPGVSGKRYLAVTGTDSDRLFISPAIGGRNAITPAELDSVWSGRSYIPWRNFLNIPAGLRPGAGGEPVGRLQTLLGDAGVYAGNPSGAYDPATIAAVKRFQTMRGIEPDGMAGSQTLMLLYRSAGRYFHPELTKKGGPREG